VAGHEFTVERRFDALVPLIAAKSQGLNLEVTKRRKS
jgi:hypothetical protein